MRRPVSSVAGLSVVLAACGDPVAPPVAEREAPALMAGRLAESAPRASTDPRIPDSYIVVFRDGVENVSERTTRLAAEHGAQVVYTYTVALRGFAAHMSADAARSMARDASVALIEQDQVMFADATQSPTPSWGLDRIDQRNLPLSNSYTYGTTASNVYAY